MSKTEKAIVLALRLGYMSTADIIEQIGIGEDAVQFALSLLLLEHNVPNVAALAAIFAPKPPDLPPQFTSHDCVIVDCVIVDAVLPPVTAANLLNQVLGKEYCQALKIAL